MRGELPRLNLIGAGRVGRTLSRLWVEAGQVRLGSVLSRRPQAAQALVAGLGTGVVAEGLAQMAPAELWLLAVPDTQIAAVAAALADQAAPPAVVWHASGFFSSALLAPLHSRGWAVASAHPALSFADVDLAMQQFPATVCALEGDAVAVTALRALFCAIGGRCFELAAADKPLYHGAAVFASNFLPVLQAVATELWQDTGVPADWLPLLVQGFVQRGAANLQALGPQAALTGPAARGDGQVLAQQGQALAARDATLGQAYQALSELAGRLARHGRVLP